MRTVRIWEFVLAVCIGIAVGWMIGFNVKLDYQTEINIPEISVGVLTAISGIYIAVSVSRQLGRNKTVSDHIATKFNKIWEEFSVINRLLSDSDSIPFPTLTYGVHTFSFSMVSLKKYFKVFDLNSSCLDSLEKEIDNLENFISSTCTLSSGDYLILAQRHILRNKVESVEQGFAVVYQKIIEKI